MPVLDLVSSELAAGANYNHQVENVLSESDPE
jgi:hypothetical protein